MDTPSKPPAGSRPVLAGLKCVAAAVALLAQALLAPGAEPASNSPPAAPVTAPAPADWAAGTFLGRCAGCHSLAGAKLTGPELSHVAAWGDETLRQAIKRMEKNVGPLAEEQVVNLSGFLRAPNARERLKAEEARIQAQFMAKMEPANAATGRALFQGLRPLANGGIACASCHAVAGQGGNLGPDLTGVFAKMGKMPLISAIEKANFKIMGPHYQAHPITPQEATHLAEYLSRVNPRTTVSANASFAWAGTGVAACLLAVLAGYFRSRRAGREQPLKRKR